MGCQMSFNEMASQPSARYSEIGRRNPAEATRKAWQEVTIKNLRTKALVPNFHEYIPPVAMMKINSRIPRRIVINNAVTARKPPASRRKLRLMLMIRRNKGMDRAILTAING
jgi:hypothetical protein